MKAALTLLCAKHVGAVPAYMCIVRLFRRTLILRSTSRLFYFNPRIFSPVLKFPIPPLTTGQAKEPIPIVLRIMSYRLGATPLDRVASSAFLVWIPADFWLLS